MFFCVPLSGLSDELDRTHKQSNDETRTTLCSSSDVLHRSVHWPTGRINTRVLPLRRLLSSTSSDREKHVENRIPSVESKSIKRKTKHCHAKVKPILNSSMSRSSCVPIHYNKNLSLRSVILAVITKSLPSLNCSSSKSTIRRRWSSILKHSHCEVIRNHWMAQRFLFVFRYS